MPLHQSQLHPLLLVREEREDARGWQLDLGAANLPGVLKVCAFDLFSLRLRNIGKVVSKVFTLKNNKSSLKLKICSFRRCFLPELCNIT